MGSAMELVFDSTSDREFVCKKKAALCEGCYLRSRQICTRCGFSDFHMAMMRG
jgi:hypothetical protein